MEATGVYWKPVWHVLEGQFTLVLANAMHIRNVPGRKSDTNDATWIADLLAHGLIRGSFVPPAPIQELRDLTRTRKQLVGEIARHTLRIQKTLEDANLKLTQVVSDILGTSGRAILRALIAGETDPARLADLHDRATQGEPRAIDRGAARPHHPASSLPDRTASDQIEALDAAVRKLEDHLGEALAPFRDAADATDHDAGRERHGGARAHRRNRRRHDAVSQRRAIWCPGRGSVPASMRVPGSAAPPGSATPRPG